MKTKCACMNIAVIHIILFSLYMCRCCTCILLFVLNKHNHNCWIIIIKNDNYNIIVQITMQSVVTLYYIILIISTISLTIVASSYYSPLLLQINKTNYRLPIIACYYIIASLPPTLLRHKYVIFYDNLF